MSKDAPLVKQDPNFVNTVQFISQLSAVQAVSRWPVPSDVRIHWRVSRCGTCSTGTCFPNIFSSPCMYPVGRDSSFSKATRYGLYGPAIETRWGASFSTPVQTGPGFHPASHTTGTDSFPAVKRPRRGVGHPPHLASRLTFWCRNYFFLILAHLYIKCE